MPWNLGLEVSLHEREEYAFQMKGVMHEVAR